MSGRSSESTELQHPRIRSDVPFFTSMMLLSAMYVVLLAGMLVALASFTSPRHVWAALQSEEIIYATKLSLLSCTMTTIWALWVAVPIGYLMSMCCSKLTGVALALLRYTTATSSALARILFTKSWPASV